jgi:antitoxin (DNA-binding transcriptional repressor) of toxin-antitoxin stability system
MKTMTVTEVSRNFREVMDGVEEGGEEVVLMRNRRAIARLVPEPAEQTALQVLGDIYRTLDEATGNALAEAVAHGKLAGTVGDLRQDVPGLKLTVIPLGFGPGKDF